YISGYTRMRDKCRFKCNNCGNDEYITAPINIMDKRKKIPLCNICSKTHMGWMTEEEFINQLSLRWKNNEFEYISGFKNLSISAKFKCNNCSNSEYLIKPSEILRKRKSKTCNRCGNNVNPKIAKEKMYNNLRNR